MMPQGVRHSGPGPRLWTPAYNLDVHQPITVLSALALGAIDDGASAVVPLGPVATAKGLQAAGGSSSFVVSSHLATPVACD